MPTPTEYIESSGHRSVLFEEVFGREGLLVVLMVILFLFQPKDCVELVAKANIVKSKIVVDFMVSLVVKMSLLFNDVKHAFVCEINL